jgi:hypothetical protein
MKNLLKSAVLSLCMIMAVSFAYAANTAESADNTGKKTTEVQRGPNFVDENGDGICDNAGARLGKKGRRDGKGYGAGHLAKGKGLRRGARDGKGAVNRSGNTKPNYVDADGDGICDNLKSKKFSK